MTCVLILGSAPNAIEARDWPRDLFDAIVVINNAWRIREDWTHLIHPEDFPADRQPPHTTEGQRVVTHVDYVPAQNRFGGFVYAGGTMAFTAGYWVLDALRPDQICFFGCDMVYPKTGSTHFYGSGAADPLRDDPTLADLSAKASRLEYFAAEQGCALLNLSGNRSVLPYRRTGLDGLSRPHPARQVNRANANRALGLEKDAGYFVQSGRYWEVEDGFSPRVIADIDGLWSMAFAPQERDIA